MIKEIVILTGISCSGKTEYAKHLERTQGYKYISYDDFFNYKDKGLKPKYFDTIKNLAGKAEKIVLDGYFGNYDPWCEELKKQVCDNVKNVVTLVSMPVNVKRRIERYGKCEKIVYCVLPYLDMFPKHVNYAESKFIDTSGDTFKEVEGIDSVEALDFYLLDINSFAFKGYLDTLTYDKYYGDIEAIDFIGYSDGHKSWASLKNLVDWKDKSVVELGCFHGYFSFKIDEEGANTVIALDCHKQIVETTKFINWLSGHMVEVKEWKGGEEIPKCDIILCMNVLHHFKNADLALSKMNCKQAIFEIYEKQIPMIKKYFKLIKEAKSHRPDRIILLGERL